MRYATLVSVLRASEGALTTFCELVGRTGGGSKKSIRLQALEEDMRRLVPYCLQPLKTGGWVVLNRYYKPVGFYAGHGIDDEVRYAEFTGHIVHFGDLKNFGFADLSGAAEAKSTYIFDDGSSPWLGRNRAQACLDKVTRMKVALSEDPQVGAHDPSPAERDFIRAAVALVVEHPQDAYPRDAVSLMATVFIAELLKYNHQAGFNPQGRLAYQVHTGGGIVRDISISPPVSAVRNLGEPT